MIIVFYTVLLLQCDLNIYCNGFYFKYEFLPQLFFFYN